MAGQDLARVVSIKDRADWTQGTWELGEGYTAPDQSRFHVVAYDFGVKSNILRLLADRGCRITLVPAQTTADEVLKLNPDGVFLSNGPGDPEPCDYAIEATRKFLDQKLPVFGICLGHQIMGLAVGGKTVKMKTGHHGANHPCRTWRPSACSSPARTTVSRWTRPACPPTREPRTYRCSTARCRASSSPTVRPSASRATLRPARPARHRRAVRQVHQPDGRPKVKIASCPSVQT